MRKPSALRRVVRATRGGVGAGVALMDRGLGLIDHALGSALWLVRAPPPRIACLV